MAVDQQLGVDGTLMASATRSGVRIERPRPDDVARCLDRPGTTPDGCTRAAAWGAFEADGCQSGVAVVDRLTLNGARGFVGVPPERRRLRTGTELLNLLLEAAGAFGSGWLSGPHHARANEPRQLVRPMNLTTAWRVDHGIATVAICVPPASRRTTEAMP